MMSLPPGFRFHPTDTELIKYHLKRKALGKRVHFEAISEVDIYKFHPSDLPDKSCLKNRDLEWYFFCPVLRKYASGARSARATDTGYWKSTGKDRPVSYNSQTVGMIKTLVFHEGHAPKGDRTDWVIHEYRILEQELSGSGLDQSPFVVVKLFKKSGPGPKNGAQYGAPFNEHEWESDGEDKDVICVEPPLQVSDSLPLPPMVIEDEEVDIESLLDLFADDCPIPAPHASSSNDINQVNGELFIELDDIYGSLEDLIGLEDLLDDSF